MRKDGFNLARYTYLECVKHNLTVISVYKLGAEKAEKHQ